MTITEIAKQKAESAYYNMIRRSEGGQRGYENTTVCEAWQTKKNFKEWYVTNFYEVNDYNKRLTVNSTLCLDKDIRQFRYDNKVYSEDTCMLVPASLNTIVAKLENRENSVIKTSEGKFMPIHKQKHSKNSTVMPETESYEEAIFNLVRDHNFTLLKAEMEYMYKIPSYIIQQINDNVMIEESLDLNTLIQRLDVKF